MFKILASLLTFCSVLFAAEDICSTDLERVAVVSGGRIKPLYVHARLRINWLLGKNHHMKWKASEIYCRLSFDRFPSPLFVPSASERLLRILGKKTEAKISYSWLSKHKKSIQRRLLIEKGPLKEELDQLLLRLRTLEEIKAGLDWKLSLGDGHWVPVTEFNGKYKTGNLKVRFEWLYAHLRLPLWACGMLFLALVAMILRKNSIWFFRFAFAIEVLDVASRAFIGNRAPVTNMYETVAFSGLVALFLSLRFAGNNLRIFLAGAIYNIATLMMLVLADDMLDDSIRPLIPVLRNNFWLSIHVTSVTISYGAYALSWIIANLALGRKIFGKREVWQESYSLIERCMKLGVVFLVIGIASGAIWADYSWGRFWGWDPKETWSLVVLFVYMVLLHGRRWGWITARLFLFLSAQAFLVVMMAWFGVNYLLSSGLHSYGFGSGGAIFLISTFLLQLLISGLYFCRAKS